MLVGRLLGEAELLCKEHGRRSGNLHPFHLMLFAEVCVTTLHKYL